MVAKQAGASVVDRLSDRDTEKSEEIAKAAAIAETATSEPDERALITLSNGIVIRVLPVPPLVILQAVSRIERPKPPVFHNKETDRDEENPNDPGYQEAMKQYDLDQLEAATYAAMVVGTRFISAPDNSYYVGPDSDEWIRTLAVIGITFDSNNEFSRYYAWLRFHAMSTQADVEQVVNGVMAACGVTEREVQNAIALFRRLQKR